MTGAIVFAKDVLASVRFRTVRKSSAGAVERSHLQGDTTLRLTPQTARLVFGLVTPAVVIVGAISALGGAAVSMGGCTVEETAPMESAVGRPAVQGSASKSLSNYAKDDVAGSNRTGRDERLARTLSDTMAFLPVFNRPTSARGEQGALSALLGRNTEAVPSYNGLCPPDMASIDDRFCVDRYEASLIEVMPDGSEQPFSPYESLKGQVVRAVSERGVFPQGYISEVQAIQACSLSGKRLCKAKEWRQACMGPEHKTYGYANASEPGKCNDHGRSPMTALYANESLAERDKWNWERMNRPELNQIEGTLAHTGEHDECTNGYGVYDMVGNLHEWVDDPKGTFQGGYYQDTTLNGEGCQYVTMAHEARYHDYSTGFRCCSDVAP